MTTRRFPGLASEWVRQQAAGGRALPPIARLVDEHNEAVEDGFADPAPLFDVVACRKCGCTDDNACMTEEGPCFWAEDDLCSRCAYDLPLLT